MSYQAVLLYAISRRVEDCKTYNFGMRNADKLAHEDAPKMLKALERIWEMTLQLDDGTEYEHNGHGPFEGGPTCPACWAQGITMIIEQELKESK